METLDPSLGQYDVVWLLDRGEAEGAWQLGQVTSYLVICNCEAQGKGRAKGQPRKVTQRSFIDYRWWMVDILSLMLYTKFG